MTHAIGFALAGVAGMSLGLIGGGGSLLTVPILVYGFQMSAVLGTSYSLFIVGTTTLFGAIAALRKGQVDFHLALAFLIASLPGAYLTRKWVLHALPSVLWKGSAFEISRETALMAAFGLVMILAALLTAAQSSANDSDESNKSISPHARHPLVLGAMGLAVGMLTGIFGAGGGFLIVPALVILNRLPMRMAIGTSMIIVSMNAWFGLIGDLSQGLEWNWSFILLFTAMSLSGMLFGRAIGERLNPRSLKTVSVCTTFVAGLFILIREIT